MPGAAVLLAVRYERVRTALSRLVLRVAHGVHRLPRREVTRARLDNFPARLEGFLDRIASIRLPARGYAAVSGLALLNWAADCAALALAVVATGQPVPWHALLLAYGAGAAVGSTGLTPGGFGLVELAVAAALTAGGLSGAGALAAVLAYRIVNFWLVILTGWVIMLLHGDRPGGLRDRRGRRVPPGTFHRPDERWWPRHGRGTTDARRTGTGSHPLLAGLRERGPVAWVPALGGWLVTSYAAAVAVMREPRAFTVDDPRFSTARVVGPSMLSLDGAAHARHRAPFFSAFHRGGAAARLGQFAETEAARLVAAIRPDGAAELRGTVTGPLAVAVVAEALGLGHLPPDTILSAYARIVGGVTGLSGDQNAAPAGPPPDAAARSPSWPRTCAPPSARVTAAPVTAASAMAGRVTDGRHPPRASGHRPVTGPRRKTNGSRRTGAPCSRTPPGPGT